MGFLRHLILLLIFLLTKSVLASDARVLFDDRSLEQNISGVWTLDCLNQKKPVQAQKFKFARAPWKLSRRGSIFQVKNHKNQIRSQCSGDRFVVRGEFNIHGRDLNHMEIYFNQRTDWVIHLPVNQYLYGVLASEVPHNWPIEALKAQAVASRTYFLFKKKERQKWHYDVRGDTLDQVFSLKSQKYPQIIQAVDSTENFVLRDKESDEIFAAYFHSDCGGKTSTEQSVWREPTAMNQAVSDPLCQTAQKNNWSYLLGKTELVTLLKSLFFIPYGAELESIYPRVQNHDRAHVVDFLFSEKIFKRMSANDLRKLLGYGKLKSTHFKVEETSQGLLFTGRGFGHGVGLCQWGAQRWAEKGKNYEHILSHYYPSAKVEGLKNLKNQLVKSEQAKLNQ